MAEKKKIIPPNPNGTNSDDRETLGRILLKMGFVVHFGKEKKNNKMITIIEYWEEDGDDGA